MMDPMAMQLASQPDMADGFGLGQLALDPDRDIEEFRSKLRGFKVVMDVDDKGQVTKKQIPYGKRSMNDDGINYLCGSLRNYSGKGFILTNYTGNDKKEAMKMIHKRCFIEGKKTVALLAVNRREWEIDPAKRPTIINHYMDSVEAMLFRSLEDGERSKYYRGQKTVITSNQQVSAPQETKKTWW